MVFKLYLKLRYNCSNKKKIARVLAGSILEKVSPGRVPETNIFLS